MIDSYEGRVSKIVDLMTEAMREELSSDNRSRRFKRVRFLCEQAERFLHNATQSVEEYTVLNDYGGLPIRGQGEDQAELARGMIATAETLTDDNTNKSRAKNLETLVQMKSLGMHKDKDMENIYEMVRADVLRGFSAEREGGVEDTTKSVSSDKPRKEDAQGIRAEVPVRKMG